MHNNACQKCGEGTDDSSNTCLDCPQYCCKVSSSFTCHPLASASDGRARRTSRNNWRNLPIPFLPRALHPPTPPAVPPLRLFLRHGPLQQWLRWCPVDAVPFAMTPVMVWPRKLLQNNTTGREEAVLSCHRLKRYVCGIR